jgi:hypothetical protein
MWRFTAFSLLVLGLLFGVGLSLVPLERRSHALSPPPASPSVESMEQEALKPQDKGEYKDAEVLFRKCLAERQRTLAADHIDVLAAMEQSGKFAPRARREC